MTSKVRNAFVFDEPDSQPVTHVAFEVRCCDGPMIIVTSARPVWCESKVVVKCAKSCGRQYLVTAEMTHMVADRSVQKRDERAAKKAS